MSPARIDRLLVVGTAALMTAQCGCLVHLWAYAADASGESAIATAGVLLLAVPLAMAIPSRVVRAARRALGRPGPSGPPSAPDPHVLKVLLAAATIFAGVCALAALPAGLAAKLLTDWLAEEMVWTRASWLAAGLAVRLACLLPMSAGLAAAMLVGAMVRRGGGRDHYASIFRDWVLGTAGGLVLLATAWRAGANLLGMALAMPVLLLAGGGAVLVRRGVTVRPPQPGVPQPGARPPRRVSVWTTFAALAVGAAIQHRLATDVMGLGPPARLAWTAASLLGLLVFLRREDHRPAPDRAKEVGGTVGLAAVFLMQFSTAILSLEGGLGGAFFALLAAGAQVSLCALAAGVISRQRRAHAAGGGTARSYLGGACGGAGAGLLAILPAGWLPIGGAALVGAALGVMAWGACREIFLSPRPGAQRVPAALRRGRGRQARWALVGSLLLVSVTAGLLLAVREAGRTVGQVRPGPWLSAAAGPAGGAGPEQVGFMPFRRPARSEAVTAAMLEVLSRPAARGSWWLVVSSPQDVPAALPRGVVAVFASADPSASAAGLQPRRAGLEGAFLQAARAGRGQYDGVVLAPMPADHPEAWRCYNEVSLGRAIGRVRPGGAILLRTQSRRAGAADALAVAGAFLGTVQSGWAAVAEEAGGLDLLLGGPDGAVPAPQPREGLRVLPLTDLLPPPLNSATIRLLAPGARPPAVPSAHPTR